MTEFLFETYVNQLIYFTPAHPYMLKLTDLL